MKPVIIFELHQGPTKDFKTGLSDMKRVEDFYIRVGNQLYNALNVAEDTEANRSTILAAQIEFKRIEDDKHNLSIRVLKILNILK